MNIIGTIAACVLFGLACVALLGATILVWIIAIEAIREIRTK